MERLMSDLSDWLSLVDEEIVEPERPIIDPHHHLWRNHRSLNRSIDYDLNDLWADTESGHNIIATVFVECGADYRSSGPESLRPVGETDYVKSAADLSILGASEGRPPIKGIVSHVDLRLGAAVEEVISAQIDAGEGLLKGVRHATAYYPDPPAVDRYAGRIEHLMMLKEFREGFARLAPAGLSYDAWLLHPQIRELTDLAEAFPETIIIFDHFGGPLGIGPYQGKQRDIFPQWQRDVQQLSKCANVVAKLGGLAMPINGWGWDEREMPASSDELVAAHQDYYLHTIDCFGPERCMFESNFPVDKYSVSYHVLWNSFKNLVKEFSETERDQLFYKTASHVYNIS